MQFTRMSVWFTSRDSALVKAITPALAAEYAARLGQTFLAGKRTHINDAPLAGTQHQRQDLMGDVEHAEQGDLQDALPLMRIELREWQKAPR